MAYRLLDRIGNSYTGQAWLVLLLTIFFGCSLAMVHTGLGPIIEENKLNETMEKVPELVLGKVSAEKRAGLEIVARRFEVDMGGNTFWTAYEARYRNERRGWVLKNSGRGYADKIELLVGVDPEVRKITGLYILDQKETPGLGNKILEEGWRNQFIGKSAADPLFVVKTAPEKDREINAVSGATISSKSVVQIINTATARMGRALKE